MSSRTDFLEDAWLNHVTNQATYSPPAGLYLALFTVAPTGAGGGTEVTGGSYARQLISWGAVAGSVVENNTTLLFDGMPAVSVVASGIYDALTAGNLLYYKPLTTTPVSDGQAVAFYAGTVTITAD